MNVCSRQTVAVGLLAAVVAASGLVPAGSSSPAAPAGLSDAQVAALPPAVQAEYLAPLRVAAAALDSSGKAKADIYSMVAIDSSRHQVDLYVTAPALAGSIITAAKSISPSMDASLVQVRRARYTIQQLDAARVAYLSRAHNFEAYSIGPAPDGSGIEVEVANPRAAAQQIGAEQAGAAEVGQPPIVVKRGSRRNFKVYAARVSPVARQPFPRQVVSQSWAAVKWHDSPPFIGGDVLTPDGHQYCTAGIPAVRPRDHHPIMITAAHCFTAGQRVFTGGGPTWSFGNGQKGNFVGSVTSRIQQWDAETVDWANNNADESDNARWQRLTSAGYSYLGDFVCQSGARSAYLGHGTPCSIKVTNQDLWFSIDGYRTRGVEGVDVNGWGSVNGDSGGIVFTHLARSNNCQARGMVSAGGADGTPDQKRVDWPEAPDILRATNLQLNPMT